jgi:hypothetical protein
MEKTFFFEVAGCFFQSWCHVWGIQPKVFRLYQSVWCDVQIQSPQPQQYNNKTTTKPKHQMNRHTIPTGRESTFRSAL